MKLTKPADDAGRNFCCAFGEPEAFIAFAANYGVTVVPDLRLAHELGKAAGPGRREDDLPGNARRAQPESENARDVDKERLRHDGLRPGRHGSESGRRL